MRRLFAVLACAFAAPALAADPILIAPPRVYEERGPTTHVIVVVVQLPQPAAPRVQYAAPQAFPQAFYAPQTFAAPTVTLERAPVQFVQPQAVFAPAPTRAVVGTAPFTQGVITQAIVAPAVEQRRRQLSISIGTDRTRTLAPAAALPGVTDPLCPTGLCPTLRRFP